MGVIIFVVVAVSFLTEGISASCNSSEYPCNDGSCVLKSLWCDGEIDCKDGSDEEYCWRTKIILNPNKCNANFFLCHDGSCIPIVGRCDGYNSCRDKSDEENCSNMTAVAATGHVSEKESIHAIANRSSQTETPQLAVPSDYRNITYEHDTQVKNNIHDNYQSDSAKIGIKIMNPHTEHNIQSDSAVNETKERKYVSIDITKGFVEVDKYDFMKVKAQAEAWLLATRDNEYGWGDETARAITALYLSNKDLLKKSTNETKMVIKQLHLMISIALVRNQTKELPLTQLASYINALYSTCDNPRNFYGQDLVDTLRHRTNIAQSCGEFVSPLVYLTLCISESTTIEDIRKLRMYATSLKVQKIDIQALVSLAATCIPVKKYPVYYHGGSQILKRLYDKVRQEGLPENIYELSLIVQALNEGRINQDRWNRSDALRHITSMQQDNGSFGDILSTYYALPVLSGKSLISLAKHCNPIKKTDMVPVDILMNGKDEKYYISYSLYFGYPIEKSQTIRIKVGKSTNFLDIMRIVEMTNPMYRFRYDIARGKPFVFSIGGIVNDAEQGMYWNMYYNVRNSTGEANLQQYDGDIRSFIPTAEDHVVFWMKKLY